MNETIGESLARLSAINRDVDMVNRALGELLLRMAETHRGEHLASDRLRTIGHELVSLAGDLTKLGVDMAKWAEELDRAPEQ